jgi:hypothetical protein
LSPPLSPLLDLPLAAVGWGSGLYQGSMVRPEFGGDAFEDLIRT